MHIPFEFHFCQYPFYHFFSDNDKLHLSLCPYKRYTNVIKNYINDEYAIYQYISN